MQFTSKTTLYVLLIVICAHSFSHLPVLIPHLSNITGSFFRSAALIVLVTNAYALQIIFMSRCHLLKKLLNFAYPFPKYFNYLFDMCVILQGKFPIQDLFYKWCFSAELPWYDRFKRLHILMDELFSHSQKRLQLGRAKIVNDTCWNSYWEYWSACRLRLRWLDCI